MPRKKPAQATPLLLHEAPDDDDVDHNRRREQQQLRRHATLVDISDNPVACLPLLKHSCYGSRTLAVAEEKKLPKAQVQWRASQRSAAWRLERQLNAQWTLDDLVDSHLARLHAHYNLPPRSRDVARLLMPPWNPPLENAAFSWLGDWRPSAILSLVPLLASYSPTFPPLSARALHALAEASKRIRTHEEAIDEELAELQATCVLNLPFGRAGMNGDDVLTAVISREMQKMERVLKMAQRLRYQALETAVNRVLDHTQAAAFLVTFAGVQDWVHQKAARWRARVGPVAIGLGASRATC